MMYEKMALEEFQASQAYELDFKHKLDIYEEEVKNELSRKPYFSWRQVHDHLRENHSDFPNVNGKTVFNLVMHIRNKYGIAKSYCKRPLLGVATHRATHYNRNKELLKITFTFLPRNIEQIGKSFQHFFIIGSFSQHICSIAN